MSKDKAEKNITILNVDDNDAARYSISRILCHAGFDVIEAANGEDALRLAKEEKPDLILLDINLPDIDGFEVCQRIKSDPTTSLIPTIHISGTYQDNENRVKGLNIGADCYLTHPIEPPVLTSTIKALLRMRRAESDVLNAVEQWRATLDAISDSMCLLDTERRILRCNKAMTNLIGKPFDEIIGHTCWKLVHGTSEPIEECPFVRTRETHRRETQVIQMGDRWFKIAVEPVLDGDGGFISAVHVMTDITEQKRAEEALQESVSRFQSLFEQSNDAIFIHDLKGQILDVNARACEMLGYDEERLTSMAVGMVYPESELEVSMKAVQETAEKGHARFESRFKRADGTTLDVEISSRIIIDTGKQIVQGIVRDISSRKQAEEELRRSIQREAQAYTQGRLEVIETILHNIGNAITNVTIGFGTVYENLANNRLTRHITALADAVKEHQDNFADYVQNNPQGQKVAPFILALADGFAEQDKRWKGIVDRVRRRAEHIADIVRTQKAFGSGGGYRKEINLRNAINDALFVIQESISKRGIELSVDWDNAPEEITIQESQFHQMLVNLVKNSIEAIDELVAAKLPTPGPSQEGSYCVRPDAPFIKIRCYVESDLLILEVTDNGIGIEKDKLTDIFGAGYTTKKSGTGLGLHSVANFVQSIRGQIRALSDGIGKGATIRISLPLYSVQ